MNNQPNILIISPAEVYLFTANHNHFSTSLYWHPYFRCTHLHFSILDIHFFAAQPSKFPSASPSIRPTRLPSVYPSAGYYYPLLFFTRFSSPSCFLSSFLSSFVSSRFCFTTLLSHFFFFSVLSFCFFQSPPL